MAGRAQMDLHDGQILNQQTDKPGTQFISFSTYSFDMGDFSAKGGKREPRLGELSISELLYPDPESDFYKKNAASFRSEIHQRFSTPFFSLVYALLAVVYLGRPRTTREGRTSLLFTCFVIGAVVFGLGIAGVNIVGKQLWALWILYGVPAGLALICLAMLRFDIPAPAFALPSLRIPLPFRFAGAKRAAGGAA